MFEVFAKVGSNDFLDPYKEGHPLYADKKFTQFQFEHNQFKLVGLKRKGERGDTFENDQYFVMIVGQVYFKYQYAGSNEFFLTAEDVMTEYKADHSKWLSKIKGSFTIFLYDKELEKLKVVNDQFALRPMYYTRLNGEVIISNNLNNFKSYSKSINEVVLLEKLLFNYSLDNQTLLTGVKYLEPGQVLDIKETKIVTHKYFRLSELIFPLENEKYSPSKFQQLLSFSILQKSGEGNEVVSSLTGGFDGRAIVSSLIKDKKSFSTYSFGKKGGENTVIPEKIGEKLGFNHRSIQLEESFEKDYAKFALEAIYFSDGLSLFEKAPFPYAMNQLQKGSPKVLSGALGGELMRPIPEIGAYVNQAYHDIIYKGVDIDFFSYFEENGMLKYIDMAVIDNNKQELFERVHLKRKELRGKRKESSGYLYALYDMISLGFRMYYGGELHMERFYLDNQLPFFDYDIIAYLYKTDYREVHKKTFDKSWSLELKAQKAYAELYELNCPKLGEIELDRGYAPNRVNGLFGRWNIPVKTKRKDEEYKNMSPEYATAEWSKILYKRLLSMELRSSSMFKVDAIKKRMKNEEEVPYNQSFNHLLGIYTWIHLV